LVPILLPLVLVVGLPVLGINVLPLLGALGLIALGVILDLNGKVLQLLGILIEKLGRFLDMTLGWLLGLIVNVITWLHNFLTSLPVLNLDPSFSMDPITVTNDPITVYPGWLPEMNGITIATTGTDNNGNGNNGGSDIDTNTTGNNGNTTAPDEVTPGTSNSNNELGLPTSTTDADKNRQALPDTGIQAGATVVGWLLALFAGFIIWFKRRRKGQ
ncbi:LPXTG cell wall anchor domain-containing protein, partial [Furfurilactobacillus sp. WILCCON 0119]